MQHGDWVLVHHAVNNAMDLFGVNDGLQVYTEHGGERRYVYVRKGAVRRREFSFADDEKPGIYLEWEDPKTDEI